MNPPGVAPVTTGPGGCTAVAVRHVPVVDAVEVELPVAAVLVSCRYPTIPTIPAAVVGR